MKNKINWALYEKARALQRAYIIIYKSEFIFIIHSSRAVFYYTPISLLFNNIRFRRIIDATDNQLQSSCLINIFQLR